MSRTESSIGEAKRTAAALGIDYRAHLPKPSELRADVRAALKAAGVRPQPKSCFGNAQRAVINQDEIPLLYCEGTATNDVHSFAHAWVRTADGVDHDVTLRGPHSLVASIVLARKETAARLLALGCYGPLAEGSDV